MTFALRLIATLALAVATTASSCEGAFGPDRSIVLPITEIEAPSEVAPGQAVLVRFTVTSGGCRRFERVDAVRTAGRVTLTARGRDSSGPRISCPADIRTDVREYRAEPPVSDPFTIAARQPDGTEATRTVRVR